MAIRLPTVTKIINWTTQDINFIQTSKIYLITCISINDHLHGNSGRHDIKLSVLYADAADMISPFTQMELRAFTWARAATSKDVESLA